MIDAIASERQYWHHLRDIWAALDPALRGRLLVPSSLLDEAQGPWQTAQLGRPHTPLVLVASIQDHRRALVTGARTILIEHGAGQVYVDGRGKDHPAYSGGIRREAVALFLCPNEVVAERNRARYPETPCVVAGSPRLDHLRTIEHLPRIDRPVVAISFHPDVGICPETQSAYPFFLPAMEALAQDDRFHLLGHGHPRMWPRLELRWGVLGIEPVREFEEVVARADLYCCDNSSSQPEFAAATGRPLLWLNAPWWRREVEHGARFYEWPRGQVQVDDPADLPAKILEALEDAPMVRAARQAMVASVFPLQDGRSAQRAVAAIETMVREGAGVTLQQ